jgi:anaerobic ribonucleoside-triphosphate reductase activating protein
MNSSLNKMLSQPEAVNVAYMVEHCRVLGPGDRFVLWVQGCPLRCAGCHNPQFQDFVDRHWVSVDELSDTVLAVRGIEGLTLVGGEPFVQAQALAKLARKVRVEGLSLMSYSGFTHEKLLSGAIPHADELLRETDLLLDGPYRGDLPTNRPWRGSDNQRLICLSDRHREQISEWNLPKGQQFELRLSSQGNLEVLGIPPADLSDLDLTQPNRLAEKGSKVFGGQSC